MSKRIGLSPMLDVCFVILMMVGGLLTGCITTQQATLTAMDTSIVVANYDDVKSSILEVSKSGKFSNEELQAIDAAETVFTDTYNDLKDPMTPVTYSQLFAASESIVQVYDAVKKVVVDHWDEFSPSDKMRLEDFDARLARVYEQMVAARDSEDAKAIYDSTGQYLELLSLVAKVGLAAM